MADPLNSLPLSMRYSLTGSDTIPSTTRLHRWDSTSSSYSSSSNNIINIPVAADGFIQASEGYLYLQVVNNDASACNLDFDANSLIDKIEISVLGSSGKVETVENYNTYSILKECYTADTAMKNYLNNVSGGATVSTGLTPSGLAIAAAHSRHVAIKLHGLAFLNDYYKKALPMGMPQFTLQITLASANEAFKWAAGVVTATAYTVQNARWYAPVYRIENEAVMASYANDLNTGTLSWVGESASSIINTRAASAGTQRFLLNPSFRSLNGIVSAQRPSAGLTTATSNVLAATNLDNISSFQHRIQGSLYPQDGIDFASATNGNDQSRAYIEAVGAFAPHGKAKAEGDTVSLTQFGADTANNGKGVLAVNLKRFSESQLINVGLNTSSNASPTTLEVTYSGAGAAQQVLSFALYDIMFMLRNGVVETQF